jgi:hypothetical protein
MLVRYPAMIASLRRIFIGMLVAVPLVAAITAALLRLPQIVALVVALLGVAALMASETFHSKALAALGGSLALGGVLAWALLAAKLVETAG